MNGSGASVARRELGRRLQRLREAAGITAEGVEIGRIASRAKLWRIEHSDVTVKLPDVWALCCLYRVDPAQTAQLTNMAISAAAPGWWEDYTELLPNGLRLLTSLMLTADRVFQWHETVVPGNFQTADYARAIFRASHPDWSDEQVERLLEPRIERRERLLARYPAPRVTTVLGEGVLARPVGGPAVMAAQVDFLCAFTRRSEIDISVVPFSIGAHAAPAGAFMIMEFDAADHPDVVYVEGQTGEQYLERSEELAKYRRTFDLVRRKSAAICEFVSR